MVCASLLAGAIFKFKAYYKVIIERVQALAVFCILACHSIPLAIVALVSGEGKVVDGCMMTLYHLECFVLQPSLHFFSFIFIRGNRV